MILNNLNRSTVSYKNWFALNMKNNIKIIVWVWTRSSYIIVCVQVDAAMASSEMFSSYIGSEVLGFRFVSFVIDPLF